MEYLDIVNDRDYVVGKAEKEEAHEKRLLHRFVHVFIINSKTEILVQRRGKLVKRGALLMDASVGGHVSSGQTYEEAAAREMREEVGVSAHLTFAFAIDDRSSDHDYQIGKLFIAYHDGPFSIDPREVDHVEFYPVDKLKQMIKASPHLFTRCFIDSFEKYLKYKDGLL